MTTRLQPTLSCDDIVGILARHEHQLRGLGVTSLSLFGSRARNDHRPDSDLDILIDYDPLSRFSILTLARIQNLIEDEVGCTVQVSTRSSFKGSSLDRIDAHAIHVF